MCESLESGGDGGSGGGCAGVEGGEGVSEVVLPTTSDVLYRSAIFGSLDHATVILRHAIELLIFP